MKFAFIGPDSPIPPIKWGACESVIWQYKVELEKLGHTVDIYNHGINTAMMEEVDSKDYDFIQIHYDELVPAIIHHGGFYKPWAVTTHFGWIHHPEKWGAYYHSIHNSIRQHAPDIIALSKEIADIYRRDGVREIASVTHLRNGCEAESFNYNPSPSKGAVCVGKIETRKKHPHLFPFLEKYETLCDFYGPIGDFNPPSDNYFAKYCGSWTRDELRQQLTNYRTLILMSEGEADPLVTKEALAAGLCVIVSRDASANLPAPADVPYVRILDDYRDLSTAIPEMNAINDLHRSQIREMALNHFAWSKIIPEYLEIVNKIIASYG